MSEVRITVGERSYTIACDPGEEERIVRLGELVDTHYAKLGKARAVSEAQNLIFAALFMADALSEANEEVARLRQASGPAAGDSSNPDEGGAKRGDALANQLEAIASRVERAADTLDAQGKTS